MKKIYFIFLLLSASISLELSAQPYVPLLGNQNRWSFSENYFPVSQPQRSAAICNYPLWLTPSTPMYTDQDTLLSGVVYKTLRMDPVFSQCEVGYLREDTAAKKTYFIDNLFNPEIILYDFSMNIGDTIHRNFIPGDYYSDGLYRLDSIAVRNTPKGPRRYFWLNPQQGPQFNTMLWIEGSGNPISFLYTHSYNQSSIGWFSQCIETPHDNIFLVTCFVRDSVTEYYDSCGYATAYQFSSCFNIQDSCTYGNICGTSRTIPTNDFSIYPNPGSGMLNIRFSKPVSGSTSYKITDVGGKLLLEGSFPVKHTAASYDFTINTENLAEGIYLLSCRLGNETIYKKLIIKNP